MSARHWPGNGPDEVWEDFVAIEEPLEIRVNGRGVAVTMRSPGDDRDLAAGFLLSEGVIQGPTDLLDVLICRDLPDGHEGNVVEAVLAPQLVVNFERLTRHVFSTSSCGLCGKSVLDAVRQSFPTVPAGPAFLPAVLAGMPAKLRSAQPGFAKTGGVHACALFNLAGELICLREDVGRHNALDKVIGWALREGRLPLRDCALLVSGRVSFELVQKSRAAGLPLIAGIGAPSSLAISCARDGGQTLVGFLRADRFNVYSSFERTDTTPSRSSS